MARYPEIQYVRYYTPGTAARKLEVPVKQNSARQIPTRKRQKKIVVHLDPVAAIGIVAATVMLILMLTGVSSLRQAQQEKVQMEQYVVSLQKEYASLQNTYEASYDLQEVESMALALGMVPREQVQQITMQVADPETAEQTTVWENIRTFLTGLFA